MLWKRNHSIYASSAHKQEIVVQNEHVKNRNLLVPRPLLSSSANQTIQQAQNAKFIVRKQSKSKSISRNLIPGTFFLHRGNNHNVVKTVLENMGFSENLGKETCSLIWYQGKDVPKRDFLKKQYNPKATNYLPNHSQITNKQKLFENISKYDPSCVGTFIPQTFVVDFKDSLANVQNNLSEFLIAFFKKAGLQKQPKRSNSLCISNYYGEICIPFVKLFRYVNEGKRNEDSPKIKSNKNTLWIVKPSFLNRGQGIEVISTLKQLQNILSEDSQQISIRMYQPEQKNTPSCFIIQQYIMDPLLYLGYKFDIRAWILLRSSKTNGLEVYIYKKAYTRLACHKYTVESKDEQAYTDGDDNQRKTLIRSNNENSPPKIGRLKSIDTNDRYIHLTNNAVQKNCKQYGNLHEGNQLLVSDLVDKLAIPKLTQEYLYDNFKRITKVMIQSAKEKLLSKASYGSFQLMGLDFMIDSKLNVWLIQANCNPCLEESSGILKEVIPKMLTQMFEVVKIHKLMGAKDGQPVSKTPNPDQGWERLL